MPTRRHVAYTAGWRYGDIRHCRWMFLGANLSPRRRTDAGRLRIARTAGATRRDIHFQLQRLRQTDGRTVLQARAVITVITCSSLLAKRLSPARASRDVIYTSCAMLATARPYCISSGTRNLEAAYTRYDGSCACEDEVIAAGCWISRVERVGFTCSCVM